MNGLRTRSLCLHSFDRSPGYASAPECAFDGRGYTEASHKTAESKLWIRASSGSISRVHVSLSEVVTWIVLDSCRFIDDLIHVYTYPGDVLRPQHESNSLF